MLGSCF